MPKQLGNAMAVKAYLELGAHKIPAREFMAEWKGLDKSDQAELGALAIVELQEAGEDVVLK